MPRQTKNQATTQDLEVLAGPIRTPVRKGGAIARKQASDEIKTKMDAAMKSDSHVVYLHNVSGSHFNVPPFSNKAGEEGSAVIFELGQIQHFPKEVLSEQRFAVAISKGFLTIVQEDEVEDIEAAQLKAIQKETKKSSGKAQAGVAPSGLPNNVWAAIEMIGKIDDITAPCDWL